MRRGVMVGVAAGVAAAVAVGVFVSLSGREEGQAQAVPARSATPVAEPVEVLLAEQARLLEAELAAGDEARLREVVVLPEGQVLDPGLAAGLAAAAPRLDEASFRTTGDDTASVAVTTSADAGSSRWTATLLRIDGQWKVAFTEEVP